MKMDPFEGSGVPALNCAFANASPKFAPTPITSPVERISGPSAGSTPGNFANGNTGDFTKDCETGSTPSIKPPVISRQSSSLFPSMRLTAILGSETPVALLTYGTVRDARGLTYST